MSIDIPATAIFVFVTAFTPGPNNILSSSMGAMHGYRRTLPFLLGVAVGSFVVMLLCATLTSVLAKDLPSVAPVLRAAGSLYILWLAFGVYRGFGKVIDSPDAATPLRLWNGALLQFVNPKGIFYGLTIYSVFLTPLFDHTWTLLWSTVCLALVNFSAVSTWALGGNLIRGWVNTPRRARIVGALLAAALVYTAVDMAGVHLW